MEVTDPADLVGPLAAVELAGASVLFQAEPLVLRLDRPVPDETAAQAAANLRQAPDRHRGGRRPRDGPCGAGRCRGRLPDRRRGPARARGSVAGPDDVIAAVASQPGPRWRWSRCSAPADRSTCGRPSPRSPPPTRCCSAARATTRGWRLGVRRHRRPAARRGAGGPRRARRRRAPHHARPARGAQRGRRPGPRRARGGAGRGGRRPQHRGDPPAGRRTGLLRRRRPPRVRDHHRSGHRPRRAPHPAPRPVRPPRRRPAARPPARPLHRRRHRGPGVRPPRLRPPGHPHRPARAGPGPRPRRRRDRLAPPPHRPPAHGVARPHRRDPRRRRRPRRGASSTRSPRRSQTGDPSSDGAGALGPLRGDGPDRRPRRSPARAGDGRRDPGRCRPGAVRPRRRRPGRAGRAAGPVPQRHALLRRCQPPAPCRRRLGRDHARPRRRHRRAAGRVRGRAQPVRLVLSTSSGLGCGGRARCGSARRGGRRAVPAAGRAGRGRRRGVPPAAAERTTARARTGAAPHPRVVDLSALWAGPLAASLLQRNGAEVIKVEDTRRPDGARRGDAAFYDLLNAGKRSVALDLSSPGRPGAARCARACRPTS